MNDLQRAQAMVPQGGVVLENRFGTAPGLIVRNDRTVAILLPGPPGELRPMWEKRALPWLRDHFTARLKPVHEATLRVLGLGETGVQMRVEKDILALGPIEVGYCARPGEADLRLIAPNEELLQQAAALAREKLGAHIYAEGARKPWSRPSCASLAPPAKPLQPPSRAPASMVASRITNVPRQLGNFPLRLGDLCQ